MAGRDPPYASRYTARMNSLPLNQMLRLVFIAAALATLAGCGNKGPLVLPTPPAAPIEPATVPATPAEVPAEQPTEAPTTEPATDGTTPPVPTPVPATSDGDGNG